MQGSLQGESNSAWVADQFARMFYDVLQNHPNFLNRFYKENSQLSVSLPWERQPLVAQGEQVGQQLQ